MIDPLDPFEMPVVEVPDWAPHAPDEYPVLACIQFDATGVNALDQALRLVSMHGKGPLHIAHVITDTNPSGRGEVIARHEHELETATHTLRAFVAARMGGATDGVRLHVRIGEPVPTILQLALDYDVEVVVVGTHGRKGVPRLALGSVSSKLVAAAHVPVLLAAPRDFSGMEKTLIPDPPRPS